MKNRESKTYSIWRVVWKEALIESGSRFDLIEKGGRPPSKGRNQKALHWEKDVFWINSHQKQWRQVQGRNTENTPRNYIAEVDQKCILQNIP